ncbi:response regulator [Rhodococcus sp. NPDC058521]|uniref:response regulator transcription factor n=1 Tax=Rhodococcus sp. NPDC058521 TaxID=3346536 RepID=UPI00366A0FF5
MVNRGPTAVGGEVITTMVVDDDPLVRNALGAIIGSDPDMTVVAEASDGTQVKDLVLRHRPDVVLMDVRMPLLDGIEATRELLRTVPEPPKVLVVTTFVNDSYVYDALRVGASGFLLKRADANELLRAVRTVFAGESLLFPDAIRSLVAAVAESPDPAGTGTVLTAREQEVLRSMARGLSNAEIAADMFLGVETVKTYVGNVLAKLGARDRTQAVIRAYETGFVRPGE